ncbi:inorganic phosphate transporter [Arsenicitalea aurantiaca]|uniref:Phosphate transporter n=1 Tax=Arsenicitalea aurantiaca TaxID=1783274 RepID=A0A433XB95_9HYPH|nr:inorganic phosphate transporter [Arsenicitalea aurantiaca]RUT31346.1 inorganic phosphate transporter [Arsenicitalea aurantiaca]
MAKTALDKDLDKVVRLETATHDLSRSLAGPGIALVFLFGVLIWASVSVTQGPLSTLVIVAAVIAAYMALNVGANDVANNMGPAVGSKALTMGGALVIAAICEAAGALLAGGDVVNTISRDLLRPEAAMMDAPRFIMVMMSAFLASALWVNLATVVGAPVSTTHSVVGGVIGAGVAAAGFGIVAWPMLTAIVASWVISPALGGFFAAGLLALIRHTITTQADRISAARVWVPALVALMIGVFTMYMALKGFSRVWRPGFVTVLALGIAGGAIGWAVAVPWVRRRSEGMENRNKHIATLFRLPLIFATALLSFAHGANDVANAVGPLAAIVAAAESGSSQTGSVVLPIWVLAIGALGIALGLALFGPRLIRTVGEKITRMNEIRAFCVAISAATTVLIASALGLPVSSTHIAVGAVFGVGFLREFYSNQGLVRPQVSANAFMVDPRTLNATAEDALANDQKRERRRLVRRQHALGIGAAWVITVPASALLAALLFFVLTSLIRF